MRHREDQGRWRKRLLQEGSVVLGFLAMLAVPASATIIVTTGAGSAVDTAHRTATFNSVVNGTNLINYAENGLRITSNTFAFIGPPSDPTFDPTGHSGLGGFLGGFHLPNNGSTQLTSIKTTDGTEFEAIELNIGNGFQLASSHVRYEIVDDGNIIDVGAFTVLSGSVIGFEIDTGGFDELRIGAYLALSLAQNPPGGTMQAAALDNLRTELFPPPAVIPEPGTMAMLSSGILGLVGFGWRRRKLAWPKGNIET
jgi:hypothetical protein